MSRREPAYLNCAGSRTSRFTLLRGVEPICKQMTGIRRSIHEKHDYETKLHSFEKVSRQRQKMVQKSKISSKLVHAWIRNGKFGREKCKQYDGF